MKKKEQIPESVRMAFDRWMRVNLWRATLTASEQGKLGAAKMQLNRELRRHGLRFDEVAQAMV